MVIGNGLVATAFLKDYQDDDRFLIFASGVSNSSETNPDKFNEEKHLFIQTAKANPEKHIVYFTSFVDSSKQKTLYAEHKNEMVDLVKKTHNYYTILRLPQIMGNGGNPNALVNFIVSKLKNQEEIFVYKNVYKGLIDVEDMKRVVDILVKRWTDKNTLVEFPYIEKLLAKQIVILIAKQLSVEPKMKFIDHEFCDLPEPSMAVDMILKHLNINPEGYTESIIKKYIR